MLHLLQIDPYKVLTSLIFSIQNSWQFSLLELSPPAGCVPALSGDPTPTNTVTFSSDSYSLYTSTVQTGRPSANAALPLPHSPSNFLSPFRPLCIFCLCTIITASCSWLFLYTACFLFPRTPSGFFYGMLRSLSQEHRTFTLSFVPSRSPYLYPGI